MMLAIDYTATILDDEPYNIENLEDIEYTTTMLDSELYNIEKLKVSDNNAKISMFSINEDIQRNNSSNYENRTLVDKEYADFKSVLARNHLISK